MYNFIIFWDSSFLSFTLCPNDCPLDSSEGRRQHSDCHHCVRAGRSHRLGHHRYGDQGRGRSFPEEGHHWEEVSEHTHTHACTCMNTCTDYGIQRDYQDHAPWEQTHLPLCKYCLPLLAHPSPCRVWLHHCQARLTTKARPLSGPRPILSGLSEILWKYSTRNVHHLLAYLVFEESQWEDCWKRGHMIDYGSNTFWYVLLLS